MVIYPFSGQTKRTCRHHCLIKVESKVILLVDLVVRAVLAVTLDHLQLVRSRFRILVPDIDSFSVLILSNDVSAVNKLLASKFCTDSDSDSSSAGSDTRRSPRT